MKVFSKIGSFFVRVARWIANTDLREAAEYAIQVARILRIEIPEVTIAAVKRAYFIYGVPLSEALADGQLTPDEIKMLIGRLAGVLIERKFPQLNTTQALLLANGGYEDTKPAK